MNNKCKKSIKKSESLPIELGLVTLHDSLLSRRACVLESTLNEVSFNRSIILDQENSAYSHISTFSSPLTSFPIVPPTTHAHSTPPASHTAPLTDNKVNVTSTGTQTHCDLDTNLDTATVVEINESFCSAVTTTTDILSSDVAHDQLNITNDLSPSPSPSCI
jgi:hypothetical protein